MATGETDPEITAVLIDDHEMVAESLGFALGRGGITVLSRAGSLEAGVPMVAAHSPDIVLLDFRLPDGDGVEGLRVLRRTAPEIPVLVLTAVADELTAADVLRAGARGYVTKDAPIAELIDAIRGAVAGRTVVPSGLVGSVVNELAQPGRRTGDDLTERQREALQFLADGCGIDDVAARMYVSRNTARKHVQAVLFKLGAHTQLEAVALARAAGLVD